jgi:hypothetical protein
MLYRLFAILVLLPHLASGQSSRFELGLSVPFGIKFGIAGHAGSRYSMFAITGFSLASRVKGTEEGSMIWQQHVGLVYDRLSYKANSGDYIDAELYSLLVEPEVLVPVRNERLTFSIGIGAYITLDAVAVSHTNTQSLGAFYADIDSISMVLNEKSRKILPFVSAGICYRFNRRYHLSGKVKQSMRNYFEPATELNYSTLGRMSKLEVSYQPTIFELGVALFFGKE